MKAGRTDSKKMILARQTIPEFSDLKFIALFENSGTSIVIVDKEGIYQLVNSRAAKKFGLETNEIIGKSMFDLLLPETAQKYFDRNRKLIESGVGEEYEDTFQLPTGTKTFLITDSVLKDEHGIGYALLSSSVDITAQKQTEDALRGSEEKYHSLIESAPDALLQGDSNGNLITVNNKASKLTGFSREELLSMHISQLFPTEVLINKPIRYDLQKSEGNIITERELLTKSGERIQIEMSTCTMTNNTILSFLRDITDRRKVDEDLKANYALLHIAGQTARFGGWSLNQNENFVTWSDEVASIHEMPAGYSPSIEDGIRFYAPEWRETISDAVSNCLERGIPFDKEMELITAKSNRIWVRVTGESVRDESGNIVKVQGSFQDISERKQIENELILEKTLIDAIFNSIPGMIYLYDLEGNLVRWNMKHEIMTGYTDEELSHFKLLDWYKGDVESQIAVNEGVNSTILKGFGTAETNLQKKDGTTIPMYFTASPLTINGKKYFTGIGIDISARKQIEESLKISEEIFNQFLENSPIYIFFKDENIRSLRLSRNYEKMLGKPLDEILGKSMDELFPSDLAKSMVENDIQILKNGVEFSVEEEFNGRYYSTIKFPIQIEGKPKFLAGFSIDITEQKLAEQALKERETSLRELNATKDKFFSIIAHDLKSPFNSIIGFSSLLSRRIEEADYVGLGKYAGIIQNSSQQALDLLMNLLEWTQSQTGRMVFTPEKIDMVDMINQSVKLLNGLALQKLITIHTKTPVNLPVFADNAMINTILRNLISNAIKFTNMGGEIVILAEQMPNELVVSVTDDGVGINKESIGRLFRIDETLTTLGTQMEKGTGLGLVLCKEFIGKHRGRIWVESEPGKGSKFFFSIPGGIAVNSSL